MDATEWEQQFEESISRERDAVIDLLDAARAVTGAFRPAGTTEADATTSFSQKYSQWREAADEVAQPRKSLLDASNHVGQCIVLTQGQV